MPGASGQQFRKISAQPKIQLNIDDDVLSGFGDVTNHAFLDRQRNKGGGEPS